MRHTLIGIGSICILAGILSFLIPPMTSWMTLLLLLIGAGSTVWGVWILE